MLPPDIVSVMERSGRHKIAPHSSGEPGPLDPGWQPIIPFAVEQQARAEPEEYVVALAEVVVPVGGWALYGAAELALDVMDHDLDNPAYRALFVGGLDVRRKAGVPWVMLNSFDHVYWEQAHPVSRGCPSGILLLARPSISLPWRSSRNAGSRRSLRGTTPS